MIALVSLSVSFLMRTVSHTSLPPASHFIPESDTSILLAELLLRREAKNLNYIDLARRIVRF